MKFFLTLVLACFASISSAQTKSRTIQQPDPAKKTEVVEVSCGQCQFGLKGKSCDLAIRINDKAYFVDGTHINSHGDAHAADGFCNAIRKASVQGELKGDRFLVSYLKLLPETDKKKP